MSKNMKKYFNATLATAVAASGVAVVAPVAVEASATFTDVKASDYFYNDILNLKERGIIKGFEDGAFRPNQAVTRGQVAKILAGVLGLDTTNVKDPGFTDIPTTHQYYGAIAALANAGIISGFEDGTFRQGEPVLRNHMAKMIANGFGLETAKDAASPFTDVRADYASFITALFTNNVTTGKTATTFDGGSYVTRGQLATFVVRAENVQPTEEVATEQTLTVTAVAETVKTADGEFTVAEEVKSIFTKDNAAALAGANVVATVEKNEIIAVKAITMNTSEPITFEAKADFDKLAVTKATEATLTVDGTVQELMIALADAKVSLGELAKVSKLVLAEGAKADEVIANYSKVKANITEIVNVAGEQVAKPTYSGGGSSSRTPSKTQNILAIDGDKITAAGTYGPATGNQVIEKDLVITSKDVTLQNVTIEGNLIIDEAVGEGEVYLNGVTVKGQTIVKGGGKNSVYFTDSVLATVIVNKNNGAVRIVAQGSTQVFEVQLETPALVVERNLAAGSSGFEDVIVTEAMQTAGEGFQVELEGVFDTVNSRATNVRVNLSEATDIQTLVLNVLSHISGAGTIQTARINADGSTISQRPQNLVLDIGGHVTIAGENVTESYSDPNATAVVSAIRASQGTIAVEMDNFIAGLTEEDFEVKATLDGQELELRGLYYDANKEQLKFKSIELEGNIGKTVEITVTPKHEKLSTAAVKSSFVMSTGFGGRITDIQNAGIPNLEIKFRAGSGTTAGDVVATATTDAYGYYTVNVPAGVYTGEFSAPGYLTTHMVATATSDYFSTDEHATAMRAAASQEVKVMLTWDERPSDLDSHLVGPTSNNGEFHIAYYEKQYTENGIVYADLDWDDTSSYGPETTTIRQLKDGEYRFYVHNYSGQWGSDTTLRKSGAKVSVYLGNATTPTETMAVPTGEGTETIWNVFDLIVTNNGETVTIRPVNTLEKDAQKYEYEDEFPNLDRALRLIVNASYDIEISANATQEEKVAAVQAVIDALPLPVGTGAQVIYQDGHYIAEVYGDGQGEGRYLYPTFTFIEEESVATADTIEFTFDELVTTTDIASIDVTEIYATTADMTTVTTKDGVTVTTTDAGALAINFGSLTVSTADTVVIVVIDSEGNETPYEVKFNGTAWVATVRSTQNND
ncbi:MAG: S-layer homology domain-containing protein [Solibacillus sp.]